MLRTFAQAMVRLLADDLDIGEARSGPPAWRTKAVQPGEPSEPLPVMHHLLRSRNPRALPVLILGHQPQRLDDPRPLRRVGQRLRTPG